MRKNILILFLFLAAVLAGCFSRPDASQNGIQVSRARLVIPPTGTDDPGASAAAYMQIKNTTANPDRLVRVSADFGTASLHESMTHAGVSSMQALEGIDLPAGALLELKTGSTHIMIMDLKKGLKPGDAALLTLEFEKAGRVTVPLEVSGY